LDDQKLTAENAKFLKIYSGDDNDEEEVSEENKVEI
jgi:hypothetical protein